MFAKEQKMKQLGGWVVRETKHVGVISLGHTADMLVQHLCACEPVHRMCLSVSGLEDVAHWPTEHQLGVVMYVVEQGHSKAVDVATRLKASLEQSTTPLLVVVVPALVAEAWDDSYWSALRLQCAGMLVLQAEADTGRDSVLRQLLQFDAVLRTALDMDTTIQLEVEDIVDCMAGLRSRIYVKSQADELQSWMQEVAAQCDRLEQPAQTLGVFTEVSWTKPLTTVRMMKSKLGESFPQLPEPQLHTWFMESTGRALRSFVITSA